MSSAESNTVCALCFVRGNVHQCLHCFGRFNDLRDLVEHQRSRGHIGGHFDPPLPRRVRTLRLPARFQNTTAEDSDGQLRQLDDLVRAVDEFDRQIVSDVDSDDDEEADEPEQQIDDQTPSQSSTSSAVARPDSSSSSPAVPTSAAAAASAAPQPSLSEAESADPAPTPDMPQLPDQLPDSLTFLPTVGNFGGFKCTDCGGTYRFTKFNIGTKTPTLSPATRHTGVALFKKISEDESTTLPARKPDGLCDKAWTELKTIAQKNKRPRGGIRKFVSTDTSSARVPSSLAFKIVDFVAQNRLSLSIVDSSTFRALVGHGAVTKPSIPARRQLMVSLEQRSLQCTKLVAAELLSADAIALTMDGGQDAVSRDHVAVTAHFLASDAKLESRFLCATRIGSGTTFGGRSTSDTLVAVCVDALTTLGSACDSPVPSSNFLSKVCGIVADGAPNVQKAAAALAEHANVMRQHSGPVVGSHGVSYARRCAVHAIQLVLKHLATALPGVSSQLALCQLLSRKSRTKALRNSGVKSIPQAVSTRFNSRISSAKAVIEQHGRLTIAVAGCTPRDRHKHAVQEALRHLDVDVLRDFVDLLSLLCNFTDWLGSESEVTISLIVPLVEMSRENGLAFCTIDRATVPTNPPDNAKRQRAIRLAEWKTEFQAVFDGYLSDYLDDSACKLAYALDVRLPWTMVKQERRARVKEELRKKLIEMALADLKNRRAESERAVAARPSKRARRDGVGSGQSLSFHDDDSEDEADVAADVDSDLELEDRAKKVADAELKEIAKAKKESQALAIALAEQRARPGENAEVQWHDLTAGRNPFLLLAQLDAPLCSKLAQWYLLIPGAETASERVFSQLLLTSRKQRNRLGARTTTQLLNVKLNGPKVGVFRK